MRNHKTDIRQLSSYALIALSYLIAMGWGEYQFHWLHKAAPILLLAWLIARTSVNYQMLAILALICSAAGDVLLALSIPHSFSLGLGAFLLAHLFYICIFWQRLSGPIRLDVPIVLLMFGLMLLAALILPNTGNLFWPVLVYMLVISVMAITATLIRAQAPMIAAGAIIFVLSDSLIAMNKFVVSIPASDYLIMLTYYLAQLLLFLGLTRPFSQGSVPLATTNSVR